MSDGHACFLENGYDACSYCWVPFGARESTGELSRHVPHPGFGSGINYTHGPVVHAVTGETYEYVGASEGGTPLAHPDCYRAYAEQVNDTDRTLAEFGVEP